jgi:hypothetical protein
MMIYDKELTKENCSLAFDPAKAKNPDITEVFANPRATALWLGYRLWHLIDQYGEEHLPKNCLEIAKQIDDSIIMQEAVKHWDTLTLSQWLWPRLMSGLHYSFWSGNVSTPTEEVMSELTGKPKEVPDSVAFARFIRPYLTGERVAEYTVSPSQISLEAHREVRP